MKKSTYYMIVPSFLGFVAVVWKNDGLTPLVDRILLPRAKTDTEEILRRQFPSAERKIHKALKELCAQLENYFNGEKYSFSFNLLNFCGCSDFQKKVLLKTAESPPGKVATYGQLAHLVGNPRAMRAVGTALAQNPFPIIYPCHRVIRSTGNVGCFGGGQEMKIQLLCHEGVAMHGFGTVYPQYFWKISLTKNN